MHADAAVSRRSAPGCSPNSRPEGQANLLVMPTLDAANIAFNLLKALTECGRRSGRS